MCEKKIDVPAMFGKMVFGEQQMQQRLPAEAYRAWQQSRILPPIFSMSCR